MTTGNTVDDVDAPPDTGTPHSGDLLPPDAALVLRAQDGDVGAFEALVQRYQGRLFRVAYLSVHNRADAEDLVQEAFLTAWRQLTNLLDPHAFRPWLFQICTRRATDLLRRRQARRTDPIDPHDLTDALTDGSADELRPGPPRGPEDYALIHDQMRLLGELVRSIAPPLQTCWVLREVEGLTYAQIARALSLSEPTVRGRIARARSEIASLMDERDDRTGGERDG